jgi:hypothetical protein
MTYKVLYIAAQDRNQVGQARQMLGTAMAELQQADQLLRRASTTATMGVVANMRGPGLRYGRGEDVGDSMPCFGKWGCIGL